MPLYEYQVLEGERGPCEKCGPLREELQRMTEPALESCGECGRGLKRLMSRATGGLDKLSPVNLRDKGFKVLRKDDKGGYREDKDYKPRGYMDKPPGG